MLSGCRPAAPWPEAEGASISETALAGYIAKYATKGTGKSEAADRPIHSEHDIDHLRLSAHHERLIRTVWALGGQLRYQHLNLRKWTHMLGFRGHFLTKSQRYSTTFTAIKNERRTYQLAQLLGELGHHDAPVLVINHWQLTGAGHRNDAERELAHAIGAGARQRLGGHMTREGYR